MESVLASCTYPGNYFMKAWQSTRVATNEDF